jgi:lipoprotein-anchoring transpeptidase ErfK/SrfK
VASGGPSPSVLPAVSVEPDGVELHEVAQHVPIIAAKGMYIMIRDKPDKKGARDLGYLRLGGAVQRSEAPVGKRNCEGDWYQVVPRGYACVDKDATVDRQDPIVRAASRRPDLSKPMPYAYGFVRAVLPLYLKVPNREEQLAVEFKLAEHLSWWKEQGHLNNKADQLGANDVFIDALGVPHDEAQVTRKSTEMGEGELFGGKTNDDPVPWWLDGGRKIPNVSPFQVPDFAVFADRARRHAGLTFVGSFRAGADSFDRRFGITEDLRLAPTSKVKPDIGPTFHGVTLGAERLVLPVAWIKSKDAKRYRIDGEKVRVYKKRATYRDVVQLTGKKQYLDRRLYYETNDGKWVRARDIAIAAAPEQMPPEAKRGDKWIDISIRQQVLVLWEGQTPVYATLVSTGQDMLGDPKTTKSTVLGRFRIQSKHVTTHMDSSEGLTRDSNDPEYGKTKRRGQGTFLLQHVPWVQYFKGSYALHATYWHDVFGTARSHGCVNVSPIDAHRVFFWTKPSLPKGWHGVYAEREEDGTLVFIHE